MCYNGEVINEDWKNRLTPEIVIVIHGILGAWLREHVIGADQEFGKYYRQWRGDILNE